jgi:hypothetical protein
MTLAAAERGEGKEAYAKSSPFKIVDLERGGSARWSKITMGSFA